MYAAFAQREIEISLMDARAGSPPSASELLRRSAAAGDAWSDEVMRTWERWCAQLLEAHISYPQLAYYRSQHSNQSWLATLTTILDSTALLLARPRSPHARGAGPGHQAQLTFAMARHAVVDWTRRVLWHAPPTPDLVTELRSPRTPPCASREEGTG